ncbi:MAG: hypothetical protein U1E52_04850 [Geminicoccaceae bacterium]
MRTSWSATALLLCLASAVAAEDGLEGSYAVTASLQIPNVSGPSWQGTRILCLGADSGPGKLPVPVISPNSPFTGCDAVDLDRSATGLRYRIVCPGRDSARAQASYRLSADGFRGEVAMRLGGKNMTLTEYQEGRRLGECGATTATVDP